MASHGVPSGISFLFSHPPRCISFSAHHCSPSSSVSHGRPNQSICTCARAPFAASTPLLPPAAVTPSLPSASSLRLYIRLQQRTGSLAPLSASGVPCGSWQTQHRRRPRPRLSYVSSPVPPMPCTQSITSRAFIATKAVFLPPGGAPPPPLDDADGMYGDEYADDNGLGLPGNKPGADASDASSPAQPVPHSDQVHSGEGISAVGSDGAGSESRNGSSVDRVIHGTSPEYDTWVDRNERRSLASVRGYGEVTLGAEELNEMLRAGPLQRHRYVLQPDEAFGAIFAWDAVMANSRELELKAWEAVAEETGFAPPDMDDIVRAEGMAPEAAIHRVFYWTDDWGEIKRLLFRKCEVYDAMEDGWQYTLSDGVDQWLNTLDRYGIKSVLCAPRPRARVEKTVQQVGLGHIFTNSQLVTADDEFDSLEQMYLIGAIKLERPPGKCVIFTDKPQGITAGREVSARVVALIGSHAAYEVKSADSTVGSFTELVIYHVRSLFSQEGLEVMDPETQLEEAQ